MYNTNRTRKCVCGDENLVLSDEFSKKKPAILNFGNFLILYRTFNRFQCLSVP